MHPCRAAASPPPPPNEIEKVCACICVCVCVGTRGKKLHSVENSKDYQQNTHYVELQVRKEWYRTMVLKL